jgi:hypothetical protein
MGSGLVFRFTGFLAGRWEWVGRDVGGGSDGKGGGVGWREKSGPYFNSTGPLCFLGLLGLLIVVATRPGF